MRARRVEQQPRALDRIPAHRDGRGALALLPPVAHVRHSGDAAPGVVDLDADRHRVRPHLHPVLDRVREVRDQRRRLRVHLAALKAEAAVDAVGTIAELPVRDRDRAHPHLDPALERALPRHRRGPCDRMGAVRIGVRVAPGPVLTRHRELALELLEVRLQVPVRDRPVRTHAVARVHLEVRRVEPRRVPREVRHRSAHADAGVVLAELDGIVAADDPRVRPVELVRRSLVRHPVLVGVPERPLLEDHDPPAGAREPLRERDAARPGAHDEEIDLVPRLVARHSLEVLQPAPVPVEQPRRVVLARHRERPLGEQGLHAHSSPRETVSSTGSTANASSPSHSSVSLPR